MSQLLIGCLAPPAHTAMAHIVAKTQKMELAMDKFNKSQS